jgi:hypothetical protein
VWITVLDGIVAVGGFGQRHINVDLCTLLAEGGHAPNPTERPGKAVYPSWRLAGTYPRGHADKFSSLHITITPSVEFVV